MSELLNKAGKGSKPSKKPQITPSMLLRDENPPNMIVNPFLIFNFTVDTAEHLKKRGQVHRVVPATNKKPAGKAAEDIFKPTKTLRVTPKRKAEEAIQHPIECIQCSKCKKWRIWRGVIGGSEDLPEKWVCALNVNDSKHKECSVPQEK